MSKIGNYRRNEPRWYLHRRSVRTLDTQRHVQCLALHPMSSSFSKELETAGKDSRACHPVFATVQFGAFRFDTYGRMPAGHADKTVHVALFGFQVRPPTRTWSLASCKMRFRSQLWTSTQSFSQHGGFENSEQSQITGYTLFRLSEFRPLPPVQPWRYLVFF